MLWLNKDQVKLMFVLEGSAKRNWRGEVIKAYSHVFYVCIFVMDNRMHIIRLS